MSLSRAAALRAAAGLAFTFAALCATAEAAAPRSPSELVQIQQLVQGGAHASALTRLDAWLAQHPRDAQARFLKGVALAGANRNDEALAVYRSLADDHPELPEPHNNLAALYAARGDLEAARHALEAALRAQPAYAVAHENLGDLYARLAARSWARAVELDRTAASAQAKLKMVDGLVPLAATPAHSR